MKKLDLEQHGLHISEANVVKASQETHTLSKYREKNVRKQEAKERCTIQIPQLFHTIRGELPSLNRERA